MNKEMVKFKWDVCGQEKILKFLELAINHQQVAHAYLLVGADNLGKKTVARKFIAALLCQRTGLTVPCGKCSPCQQLYNNIYPDLYVVNREIKEKTEKFKKDITVDQIRDLKQKLQQATLLNDYKIAFIAEAQYINRNAYNALLKILEEPTPKTVIILATNSLNSLPETIISRCQVLNFLPVSSDKLSFYLESRGLSAENVDVLARLAGGFPGLAVEFSGDHDLLENYKQDVEKFFTVIGSDIAQRLELVNDLMNWDKDETINVKNLTTLLNRWLTVLRDVVLVKTGNEKLLTNIHLESEIKKIHHQFSFVAVKNMIGRIDSAFLYFNHNVNPKLVLENLIINL